MRLIGLFASILLIGAAIALGGDPAKFVNIPSIICVLGLSWAFGFTAWGIEFFRSYFTLAAVLFAPNVAIVPSQHPKVIASHIAQIYGAGAIAMMIGLIQLLLTLNDPTTIISALSVVLIAPLYSVFIAEALLRPGARAMEQSIERQSDREN